MNRNNIDEPRQSVQQTTEASESTKNKKNKKKKKKKSKSESSGMTASSSERKLCKATEQIPLTPNSTRDVDSFTTNNLFVSNNEPSLQRQTSESLVRPGAHSSRQRNQHANKMKGVPSLATTLVPTGSSYLMALHTLDQGQPVPSSQPDASLKDRLHRKLGAELVSTEPSHAGVNPIPRQSSARTTSREDRTARKVDEDDRRRRRPETGVRHSETASTPGELLLEMSHDDHVPKEASLRFSGPIVSVFRPASHFPTMIPDMENMARSSGPERDNPLEPTTTLSKHRRNSETNGVQPGAYQVRGRAIGAQPVWGRRLRQMGENIRGSMRSLAGSNDASEIRTSNRMLSQSRSWSETRRVEQPEHDGQRNPESVFAIGSEGDSAFASVYAEEPKTQTRKRIHILICLVVLACTGGCVGVGIAISGATHTSRPIVPPSGPPLTMAPSSTLPCKFIGANLPQVIIDCACGTSIVSAYPDDVSTNYFQLKKELTSVDDITECSSNNIALWWLANDTLYNNYDEKRWNRFLLVSLFVDWTRETPDRWNRSDGWLTSDDECTWYGITCTGVRITDLNFTDNNVKPNAGLSLNLLQFTDLISIQLTKSFLQNSIPTEIANLKNIKRLVLSDHQFTGIIPLELFKLSKLQHLDLSGSALGSSGLIGTLPQDIGLLSSLSYLALTSTRIGERLPKELYTLSNLVHLNLTLNQFDGKLSTNVGNLRMLKVLDLTSNLLSGNIPSGWRNLTGLLHLRLSHNMWSGTIPSEISSLPQLRTLSLANSKDSRGNLYGSIPSNLGLITTLSEVRLDFNTLDGSLPPQLSQLTNIGKFEIRSRMVF